MFYPDGLYTDTRLHSFFDDSKTQSKFIRVRALEVRTSVFTDGITGFFDEALNKPADHIFVGS